MSNRFTKNPRYPHTSPKLVVNVTEAEKAAIAKKAAEFGCTLSELVRAALQRAGVLPKGR